MGFSMVGEGTDMVAAGLVKPGAIASGQDQARAQSYRLVEIGSGARMVPQAEAGKAAAVEGVGEAWVEPDRLVIIGDGAEMIAAAAMGIAAVAPRPGEAWIEADGAIEIGESEREGLPIIMRPAAIIVGEREIFGSLAASLDDRGAGGDSRGEGMSAVLIGAGGPLRVVFLGGDRVGEAGQQGGCGSQEYAARGKPSRLELSRRPVFRHLGR